MTPKLQKKLIKDFPILYQQSKLDCTQTCMCWGFCCEDGWEPLIRWLSEKLEDWNNKHPKMQVQAEQVKSKFGTLRFYVNGYPNEKIGDLIQVAEYKSGLICEICGEPGSYCRTPGGWIWTMCEKHAKEQKLIFLVNSDYPDKPEIRHGITAKAKEMMKSLDKNVSENYCHGPLNAIKLDKRYAYKEKGATHISFMEHEQTKVERPDATHVFDNLVKISKDYKQRTVKESSWSKAQIKAELGE